MILASLVLCLAFRETRTSFEEGQRALSELRVEDAIGAFERALSEGPYRHRDYVRLHENLATAYAYAGRRDDAIQAFETLLMLDPGHAIRYSLSPKVTLPFEEARERAAKRKPPRIDLTWSRERPAHEPVPIDVEVAADPERVLSSGTLHFRARGSSPYERVDLELPMEGAVRRVVLPPAASSPGEPATLEIYFVARDPRGNEVYLWANPDLPREISLKSDPPAPWYANAWLWIAVGAVAAAGSSTLVYFATRDPNDAVDLRSRVER